MKKYSIKISISILLLVWSISVFAQKEKAKEKYDIPAVHSNMYWTDDTLLVVMKDEKLYPEGEIRSKYTLETFRNNVVGASTGLFFDFNDSTLNGKLTYGFIPKGDSKYPHPVYFRSSADLKQGKTFINISQVLRGRYDMIGWEKSGTGTIGYRVSTEEGRIIYDGKVTFNGTGPFEVVATLVDGPFVNKLSNQSAVISFDTNIPDASKVTINGTDFTSEESTHHEIEVDGLSPDTEYEYTVTFGSNTETYTFRTAPDPGTRNEFVFAYASDSRSGNGGGERDIYGANFYIMKKIMSLARFSDIRFMQFTGDLINGYLTNPSEMDLQYANWKRAIEPFAHYFPVYVGMGNHEALNKVFVTVRASIDRFPYDTQSAEVIFARNFVNPENGPKSEDGSSYDPSTSPNDFPPYKENVFYYTYDNTAVVVLNSDYWYSPSTELIPVISGGLHGYIMDQQLKWFKKTIKDLEKDENIDHIFITQHTPFFPNGGHVGDDMWYRGNNDYRPYIAGEPVRKGIIERRDELLQTIVNDSEKVIAILTGDEHNYCRTEIGPDTNIYPESYPNKKVQLSRTIYQINNGAAGAPYYAQEQTPWTPFTSSFTTQNALVLFKINGKSVEMEVLNPDTLEKVDEFKLR